MNSESKPWLAWGCGCAGTITHQRLGDEGFSEFGTVCGKIRNLTEEKGQPTS